MHIVGFTLHTTELTILGECVRVWHDCVVRTSLTHSLVRTHTVLVRTRGRTTPRRGLLHAVQVLASHRHRTWAKSLYKANQSEQIGRREPGGSKEWIWLNNRVASYNYFEYLELPVYFYDDRRPPPPRTNCEYLTLNRNPLTKNIYRVSFKIKLYPGWLKTDSMLKAQQSSFCLFSEIQWRFVYLFC